MTSSKKALSIAMAVTAAGLLNVATPVYAGSSDGYVHCYGVNKCKGHNDCKTSQNACKGHASCKGQGFVAMSAGACEKIGGKVDK